MGSMPAVRALMLCATVVLLSACQSEQDDDSGEVRPVRVTVVEDRASDGSVSLTGTVQAQSEINLSFRIGGRLVERLVDIGDNVSAGQLIARLDPQDEQSSLQSVRAQLLAAQAQLTEARSNHTRMSELVAEDAVSRASFDQAVALLKTAEAQVQSMRSQVGLAENRLSYTQLFSEMAGVVTDRGAEPGEVVAAGRMIVQIARESALDAMFGVPAQIKDSASANKDITVFLTSDPSVTAVGRVREVSPRADPVTGTFAVRVGLTDAPAAMRLGSTVTGQMKSDVTMGIEIPPSALMRSGGGAAVWVVDPGALTVSMRSIVIQAQNPNSIQVASGLNQGELVVTAGVHALRPGQKVRLLETAKP
jgi:RND family efflux transporter MFP subunit